MQNSKGKLKTWGLAAKESLLAYFRTFAIVWKSGALALVGYDASHIIARCSARR